MNKLMNKVECPLFLFSISLTILSGYILSDSQTSATTDSSDHIRIAVSAACTLSNVGSTTHASEIINGTYTSDIGTTTLKALCNDGDGFSIYAIGYTNEEEGNTNLVGNTLNQNIITGTATSAGSSDISNWAMKIGTVTSPTPTYPIIIAGSSADTLKEQGDPDFSDYTSIPSTYTKVAYRTSGTDVNATGYTATGSTLTTTYAVYIAKMQITDTYQGKVKYTFVHPASEEPLQPQTATSGCINYFPNGSGVIGNMGCQSIGNSDTSATLLASNFSREGYGFAGWSDVYDYKTNANAKFYGPQEDITFTAGDYTGANDGLALYAVWVKSEGSLQDSSKVSQLCGTGTGSLTAAPINGTASLASVSALTDQRDNQTYAIAKLSDGKCWMIENLRLDNTAAHNSDGTLAQGYGTSATYGNFGGLAAPESTGFTGTYSPNSLYYSGTQEGTASINIGTNGYPAYRMPRYNNLNTQSRASSPTSNVFPNDNTTVGIYSYGNYYTWHAAIADLTYVNNVNDSVTSTSICPTGWHLPTGGSVTDTVNVTANPSTWRELYNLGYSIMDVVANDSHTDANPHYTSATTNSNGDNATKAFRKFPNNYLYSGCFNTSSAEYRGSTGCYWTSTVIDRYLSESLVMNTSSLSPGTNIDNKRYGRTIRCTAST